MIKKVPVMKTNFSKKAQAYTHDLKTKILELDQSSPNYSQQIDNILASNNLLKDVSTIAGLCDHNKSFVEIINNFEDVINQLRNCSTRIDENLKELLIEVITVFNQIINEYYLGIDLSRDWMELQNKLFSRINEHLQLNVDVFGEMSANISNFYSDADEPFNLDNTPEDFNLFDLDFNIGGDFSEQGNIGDNSIEEIDPLDGFLMIQVDEEDSYLDSINLLSDDSEKSIDELTSLFTNTSIDAPIDTFIEDLDDFADDFIDDLQNLDANQNISVDDRQIDEGAEEIVEESLPMPEMLADIFLPSHEKLLGNDDETELVDIRQDKLKPKQLEDVDFDDDDTDNIWEKFNILNDWIDTDDHHQESVSDLELTKFDLPLSSNFESSNDEDFGDDNISDSSSLEYDSKLDFELDLDLSLDLSEPLIIFPQAEENSGLISPEIFKEDFSTDIDTALEESPIYQTRPQANDQKNHEQVQAHWEDLTNLEKNEISYADFVASSLDEKHHLEMDLGGNSPKSGFQFSARSNDGTIRIPLHHLEMLGNLSEELLVRRGGLDIYLHELNILSGEAQAHIRLLELQADIKNHKAIANLQNTVEQMVNVLTFTQQQTYAMKQDVGHLRKNLQQVLKHPISSLVGKFPRIFRDLSVQYGKSVELVVQGAEIEIERLLSEAIADPLELLLRNAFEHGIESPDQRQQLGKPHQGKIEFIATQNEENTIIKVNDDGDGIDVEKIRNHVEQSAAIAGVSGFSTMGMSDQQIMNLIFEPSFNIEHSNSFSELGLKLSSLKKKLSNFGGTISVQSQKGKGTEFTLVLPNILSLIRVLLIDINQMCFAIPSKIILEVIPREVLAEDSETLTWRDHSLPIVRIDALLKRNCRQNSEHILPSDSYKPANTEPSFLIIHYEDKLFALQTDACWHDQEATFHQVEGDISLPNIFLGAVILGNNQAIPLINSSELLNQSIYAHQNPLTLAHSNLDNLSSLSDFFNLGDDLPESKLVQSLSQTEPSSKKLQVNYPTKRSGQPRVLIVESSANVRRYLAMTLSKSGFLTEQVQNVAEAIAFLRERREQTPNIDLVITDLEMPQMDGFKLLSNIRDDTDLRNLPIVVLTSKNNENDHKLALELGANAYFSKPYREEELIKTLFQLVN